MSTYSLVREQHMVALSIFHYIMWVGGDIIINSYTHSYLLYIMLTSVIKHYILCLIVNRANLRN